MPCHSLPMCHCGAINIEQMVLVWHGFQHVSVHVSAAKLPLSAAGAPRTVHLFCARIIPLNSCCYAAYVPVCVSASHRFRSDGVCWSLTLTAATLTAHGASGSWLALVVSHIKAAFITSLHAEAAIVFDRACARRACWPSVRFVFLRDWQHVTATGIGSYQGGMCGLMGAMTPLCAQLLGQHQFGC